MSLKLILCASACLYLGVKLVRRKLSGGRSPPGPPGLPLLGNLLDVPPVDSHLVYAKLAKKYGPIMQLKMLNRTIIVISSAQVASDLLDTRGAIYSDRPPFHLAMFAGWAGIAGLMPRGEGWRVRRRLIHQTFGTNGTIAMQDMLRRTSVGLLRDVLRTPVDFARHVQRAATASAMKAVYGISIAQEHDLYADIASKAMEVFGTCTVPGANLIDTFPALCYVPPWVPLLGRWSRTGRELRRYPRDMIEVPYARAKDDMRKGQAQPCMALDHLELVDTEPGVTEQVVKEACANSYLGAVDPAVGTMLAFIMAMVMWPQFQTRAQAELDRVVGDRLPDFADQASLPYIEAVIRETYRRFPTVPLVEPHAVEVDDVYEGMFIPRGAEIVGNAWAIFHDEEEYSDPMVFDPERWLKDGQLDERVQDPRVATYGFGRRICPGRHFADASVFLQVAMALKCFRFEVFVETGIDHPPTGKMITGMVSTPEPFRCSITPRSPQVVALIEAAVRAIED